MRPGATHPETHNALAKGQRLDEFEILGIVGVGGFGIVYSAHDHALQREVALKEYLPASLAGRGAQQQVSVLSQSHAETFALGLRSFIGEARMLARFDHPGLLKVHRFWEANGTAYMVMPMLHGHTLRALRQAMAEPPDEAWLRQLLDGLLGPLEVLHQAEVFHRDIAPDNIHITTNGAPILLDFGAARQVIAGRSQDLTAMLKPSYAPIEQYGQAPGLRQGAWTDLYALGATLHYLITGAAPPPAPVRAMSPGGPGLAATPRAGYSAGFLGLVDWMLAPHPAQRPQSVAQLRAALAGQGPVPTAVALPSDPPWPRTEVPAAAPGPAAAAAVDDDATVLQPRPAPLRAAAPERQALDSPPAAAATAPAAPVVARPAPAVASAAGRLRLALAALLLVAAAVLVWVLTRPAAPVSPQATGPAPIPAAASAATTSAAPLPAASAATAAMTGPAAAQAAAPLPAPAATGPAPAVATGAGSAPAGVQVRRAAAGPAASASGSRWAGARPASGATASVAALLSPDGRTAPAASPAPAPVAAATPPAPAPGPAITAPAVAAPASPSSPDEACGKRVFIALHQCLLRECARPAFQGHASCIALRRMEEQNRPRDLQ